MTKAEYDELWEYLMAHPELWDDYGFTSSDKAMFTNGSWTPQKMFDSFERQGLNALESKAMLGYWSRYKKNQIVDSLNSGSISAINALGQLANSGIQLSPEETQWFNNLLSQQNADKQNQFTAEQRDSSLTSAATQLSSLGLNPASVIQTGGAGIGSGAMAQTDMSNPATTRMKMDMAKFQQKAETTRTLLNVAGRLGAAGIYGSSRALTKKAASVAASSLSHSGQEVIRGSDSVPADEWAALIAQFD